MTATKKRAKELARAKEERRRARQAAALAKKKRRQRIAAMAVVGVVVVAMIAFLMVPALLDDPAPDQSADPAAQPVASCEPAGEVQDQPLTFGAPGDAGLGGAATATFTFDTNCGDIVVTADAAAAPQTVNSMAFLAGQQYFDNTLCHRITTDGLFVLQCGDPTATGTGGPGYSVPDENLPAEGLLNYPAGTVAMANSGPGTSGSQFFIVYKDTTLPPNYTIWGTVTSGLDIVRAVADAGTTDGGTDGTPAQALMIQHATVAAQ